MWMWRNVDVLDFAGWLRAHNDGSREEKKVGFYGLDLYSLHRSVEAVIRYLEHLDPEAAKIAKARYGCFDGLAEDGQAYGHATSLGIIASCEEAVIAQLLDIQKRSAEHRTRDGRFHRDDHFYAEQNARLVKNAEQYYRSMYRGRVASWNLRDQHMTETLEALAGHLGGESKIVVWAHNSHLGDARATERAARGEWNVGQLVRERHDGQAQLVGFTTHHGTVTAADDWDEAPKRKQVRPALRDSYEALFHQVMPSFMISMRDTEQVRVLERPRLERAIGVIYRPETERASHYFTANLARQFDLVLHFDETRAVEPLDRVPGWVKDDLPETFPSGL